MRLTEKNETGFYKNINYFPSDAFENKDNDEMYNLTFTKLGQLEDIEDELGIDLITLFKALKNGIYYKTKGGIWFITYLDLQFTDNFCLGNYDQQYIFDFKDYGKTWALTKEELE